MTKLITRVGPWVALCGLLTGCATTELTSSKTKAASKFVKATPSKPAVKCLCVWQTADGFDAEGKPCRGLAGQVFFFNGDSSVPVVVDGTVRVYLFDDQGSEEDQTKPVNQFEIDSPTWNAQLTNTQFGPAYRLFVPYPRAGRHQAQLAVRLRMAPDNGPVVFSELSTVELAGYKPEKKAETDDSPTTAKVERVLRERLGDAAPNDSTAASERTNAAADGIEHAAAPTIATIRTASRGDISRMQFPNR